MPAGRRNRDMVIAGMAPERLAFDAQQQFKELLFWMM
jgi:hypothetical protein